MRFIEPRHDRWQRAVGEHGPVPNPDPQPYRLLTLEQWQAVRDAWPADLPTGVVLPNTVEAAAIAPDVGGDRPRLALVVLEFPKWTDGRAYSQARLLRVRHGFNGELRATGDVLVDMMLQLERCGFDSVQLRPDQKVEDAARALGYFAGHYQGDVRQPLPAWARDVAAELAAQAAGANTEALVGRGF